MTKMCKPQYKVILSKEVVEFLRKQNPKAVKKIVSVIDYVAAGDMNKDFFKKLENTEIWELHIDCLLFGIHARTL